MSPSTPPAALRKVLSSSTCVQQATRGSPGGRHAPFQSGRPRNTSKAPKSLLPRVPRARPETGLSRQWVACLREPGSPESGRSAAGAPVCCGPLTPGV